MRLVLSLVLCFISTTALAIGPAIFAIESWIGEGVPVFTAKQSFETPLYSDYSTTADKVGVCQLDQGEVLKFNTSFVATVEAAVIPISTAQELKVESYGFTRFLMKSQYYNDGKSKTVSVAPGDTVELLSVRAEGQCMFKVNGEVVQAGCLDFPNSEGLKPNSEWWVQADCGNVGGWLRVEDIRAHVTEERSF